MEQAITTSESGISRRTYVLLTLNLLGVIGCVLITIMLILWARCIIFPEPNTAEIILTFIKENKNKFPFDEQEDNVEKFWESTLLNYPL